MKIRYLGLIAFLLILPALGQAFVRANPQYAQDVRGFFTNQVSMPKPATLQKESVGKEQVKVVVTAHSLENGALTLTFVFPEPLIVKQRIDDCSLLLEFNQIVDLPELSAVQEKLGYLIKKFSNGYNTLYFVAKRALFFAVEADDKTLVLTMTPDFDSKLEESRTIKIARARLLVEERFYFPALCALDLLEEEYPGDKDILVLRATLEGLLPRWMNQVSILRGLNDEYPEDYDIQQLMWDAYTPHSPFLQYERQLQRTITLAAVQINGARGEDIVWATPYHTLYAGVEFLSIRGHYVSVIDNQGIGEPFLGTRNLGSLYLRDEDDEGNRLKASLYIQDRATGCGLEAGCLLPCIQGDLTVVADWHRPYYAVFEAFEYHGREDQIKFLANSVYNRCLNFSLGGGVHRVGITGTPNGFTAVFGTAQVFWNLCFPNPIFSLNYGYDADYIIQRKVKIGVDGNRYNPVPYESFEYHSLRAYFYYTWRERWNFACFAGETFNRLGGQDPTCGASLRYVEPCPCGWEVNLSYARFPSAQNQGYIAEYYTGTVTLRF